MSPPESAPHAEFDLGEGFRTAVDDAPADERVYRVALQLYEPARIADIAERASCAPDTARRHLRRLADIGVIERVSTAPTTYRRNESYFEWRKQNRLEELSTDALEERLERLTARERSFRNQYGTDTPGEVDALEHADYDGIDEVWMDLSEWETVRRRIERLETVRRRRQDDSISFGSEIA